ncbi:MAG TPA: SRPBCC family protein [Polyangia bacterium]|jgi:uncharacterized protein YndB with AHSA1/START domain|nr:SRPBCC family protein [Polyangia bacterium]
MSTLKKVLLVLAIGIGGFAVFVATRPDAYRVERSQKIEAPADVVFAQLDNFKAWSEWSPWDKLDPNMKKTYEGPAQGVGASYAWQGNDKVGKGKMTVTEVTPPTAIAYRLEFIEPFASVAQTRFTVKPEGEKATLVTWAMEGKNNFIGKGFGVFMDMDKMIGKDFEKGLGSLKTIVEAEAAKRAATPPAQAAATK